MRLILAGKVEATPQSRMYFREYVAPAIDGTRVVHLQNVAGQEKARLLARAYALLAPLQWDEPFGLAIVEAMASGTPVIAIARGAAPELVSDGITGFLVGDADEMASAVSRAANLDPMRCAVATRSRFSPVVMAAAYDLLYESVISQPRAPHEPVEVVVDSAA
jgi:glycosyltransferase involved in cell wall biosynthesis